MKDIKQLLHVENPPTIDAHAKRLYSVESAEDMPFDTDFIIDSSANGINYARKDSKLDCVWVQTHRRFSYDKFPRKMSFADFNEWRAEIRKADFTDKMASAL